MTAIKSPLKRELPLKDRSRNLVATLTEDGIEFRRKGTSERYFSTWGVLYSAAQRCTCNAAGIAVPMARGRKR